MINAKNAPGGRRAPDRLKELIQKVAEQAARDQVVILGLMIHDGSVERFSNTDLNPIQFYELLMESAAPFNEGKVN